MARPEKRWQAGRWVFGRSVACLTYPSLLTARFPATALTRMYVYVSDGGRLNTAQ